MLKPYINEEMTLEELEAEVSELMACPNISNVDAALLKAITDSLDILKKIEEV